MIRKLSMFVVLGLIAWTSSVGKPLADGPNVVVSINPVHSLAAGVMKGIGEPTLLVRGGASPHSYTLRPSEAAALQNSDVVFWVGPEMETFLKKPLEALPRGARVVALHEADGVTLLPFREAGAWEKHAERHDGGHAHQSSHGEKNMHIWLDPANAKAMVTRIVATLGDADPANASRYQANGTAMEKRLTELDAALNRDLEPIKDRPYVVFHDAYPYFEHRYGLTPVGSITVDPDRKPSARRVAEIREKIAETGASCVFSEPQFEPAIVTTVIEGTDAKAAILDPLGTDLAPGADAYFQLMRGLALAFRGCLRQSK